MGVLAVTEIVRRKAQEHADFWAAQAEKNTDRRSHYEVIAGQFQRLADGLAQPQSPTLCGQIAAVYGALDAEDCKFVDREWARMRGYILPNDGTSTLTRPDRQGETK